MKITLDLLKQWGACEVALAWFARAYPDDVEDKVSRLSGELIDAEFRNVYGLWLLHEVAARVEGEEGDEALALLIERADGAQLARIVTQITIRDTSAALARLVKEGQAEHLARVMECGSDTDAAHAAAALLVRDPAVAKYLERTLTAERAALITDARRAG
jgi:hypothetical protein